MDTLDNQICPICHKNALVLTEDDVDVPYFGKAFLFSMKCNSCGYFMSDVEAEQIKEPLRYAIEIDHEDDMKIRIVKSSNATVKVKELKMTMEPGTSSIGFVT